MDFIYSLKKTRHLFKYILYIVDGISRYLEAYPCINNDAKIILKHLETYMSKHPKPDTIIADSA